MISIRSSTAKTGNDNDRLKKTPSEPGESNAEWLKRIKARDGIILLGGNSVAHFRIRVAQSHARRDLTPSCWSMAGILLDQKTFVSVPLDLRGEASEVAHNNGIQNCRIQDYSDPKQFPNIAVIRFTADTRAIQDTVELVRRQRSILDIPGLMLSWLGFIWSAGDARNPLLEETGLPGAVMLETVYGIVGIELTPGLAAASSCPEAIWQSSKWWHGFYQEVAEGREEEDAGGHVPSGHYAVRQSAAAAVGPEDQVTDQMMVVPETEEPARAAKRRPKRGKGRSR